MDEVQMIEVLNSSQVRRFGYDEKKGSLIVDFTSGSYEYLCVPKEKYIAMLDSMTEGKSAGSFISLHIKQHYDFVKLPAEQRFTKLPEDKAVKS